MGIEKMRQEQNRKEMVSIFLELEKNEASKIKKSVIC